jgi:hypothetical protein
MPGGFVGSGPYNPLDRNPVTVIHRIGAANILEKGRHETPPMGTTDPCSCTEYTLFMSDIMAHLMQQKSHFSLARLVSQDSEGRPDTAQDEQADRWMKAVTTIRFKEFCIDNADIFWLLANMLTRYCPNVRIVVIKQSDDVVPTLLKFLGLAKYQLAHLDVAFDGTSFDYDTLRLQQMLMPEEGPIVPALPPNQVVFCEIHADQLTVHTHGDFSFNVDYMLGYVWRTLCSLQIIATHHKLPAHVSPAKKAEMHRNLVPDAWFFCDPKPLPYGHVCEEMQNTLELKSKPGFFRNPPPHPGVSQRKLMRVCVPPVACSPPEVKIYLPLLESLYVVNAETVPMWNVFRKGNLSADVLNAMPKIQYVGVCLGGVWLDPLPTHRELHLQLRDCALDAFAGQLLLNLASRPKVDDGVIPAYGKRSQRYSLQHMCGGNVSMWVEQVSRELHKQEAILSEAVVMFIWYRRCQATLVVSRQLTTWPQVDGEAAARAAELAKAAKVTNALVVNPRFKFTIKPIL